MTAKPTAVVVRLPLSADQEETLFEISERDCLNSAIAAIGTPVAGGAFKIWGNVSRENAKDLGPNQAVLMFGGSDAGPDDINLMDAEDAQAALAAAQAQNVRLQEVLRLLLADWEDCMGDRPSIGSNTARTALKGPAA